MAARLSPDQQLRHDRVRFLVQFRMRRARRGRRWMAESAARRRRYL